jgi:hypothetical protein
VSLLDHLALVTSVAALGAAGSRGASRLAPGGLERFVAACVLAAAAAALEAMVLGLAGAGTSPVALTLAAIATWAAARAFVPAPASSMRDELTAWWSEIERGPRWFLGAAAGFSLAWIAWSFRYPLIGDDGLKYHWAIVVAWVHGGSPGAATPIDTSIPFQAYPLTNEVLLAWGAGISRSWVAATLWTPASLLVGATAAWMGLTRLRAGTLVAGLGAAVLVSLPICVAQLNGPPNDVPALAWLVCTGALAIAAARRPALLVAGLVAAGLAIGTKTTTAPLALGALAVAGWRARADLRPIAGPLALGGLAAAGLAGPWYLRNLIDHGSPLWPFSSGPFGDAVPPLFAHLDASFLSHPRTMLHGRVTEYARVLGGGWVLLAGALLAPLLARRRNALAASGVVAVMLLLWAKAPYTGIDQDTLALAAVRYMLPCLAAAVFALGVAASTGTRAARTGAASVLALALGLSLARDFDVGFPVTPGAGTLLGGAVLGVLGVLGVAALGAVPRLRRARLTWPLVAAGIVLAAAGLTKAADGYVERHARLKVFDAGLISFLEAQPGFRHGSATVDTYPVTVSTVAGDRLGHRLALAKAPGRCPPRGHRLVVSSHPAQIRPIAACLIGRRLTFDDRIFRVYAAADSG